MVYYLKYLIASLQQTMKYILMISDLRQIYINPEFKSELGRKGIRRRGVFVWNQILSLEISLDTG